MAKNSHGNTGLTLVLNGLEQPGQYQSDASFEWRRTARKIPV